MKRRNRLRNRLVAAYLVATVLPVGLTVWTGIELLDRSIRAAPILELDETSRALESLGREYYQHARQTLARDAASGRVPATVYLTTGRGQWPAPIAEFWASGEAQRFQTAGPGGQTLQYMERRGASVRLYSLDLGIGMSRIAEQFAAARATVARAQPKNLRRGFFYTLAIVSSAIWFAGLAFLIYWANRLSGPVQRLARGLSAVAGGDLASRIPVDRDDEIGAATAAFNDMADQLQQSRDRLVHVTRLASWQALARKTAHEVKNSLTPIRLTMEEIIARRGGNEDEFLGQAAQIVVDEVMSLERRVRAFSELASEPPVSPEPIDVNAAVEERIALLRAAHPGVAYETRLDAARPIATADPDLIKGVLTNLLENAAEAARAGGIVRVKTAPAKDRVLVEIHDSGPGLSAQARSSIFEPTISFKKNGMGLGLSIARKSALMCGGDLSVIEGELGGAAFRISLQGERFEIARAG
jgi:two-component system, NtrC family, nitrogen regulation sensor histidine kinase NtrY